jgi:hypothetical protein
MPFAIADWAISGLGQLTRSITDRPAARQTVPDCL